MSAFDRDSHMRVVGLGAALHRFGDESAELHQEVTYDDVTMDGLITRADREATEKRVDNGIDRSLVGDRHGIYKWFGRVESPRDPKDLLRTSPDKERDLDLMRELVKDGYLEQRDDGRLQTVDAPRQCYLIAIEFVSGDWERVADDPPRSRRFTDEQWVIVDVDAAEEIGENEDRFLDAGVGVASLSPDGILTPVVPPATTEPEDETAARGLAEIVVDKK